MESKYKYGTYGFIASRDLQTTNILADKMPSSALFHAQQALEKIMKQFLMIHGNPVGLQELLRSHKLWRLAVATSIPELNNYKATLLRLGDLYFEGRYPGIDYDIPTDDEAEELISEVNDVFRIIDEKIEL